MDTNEIEVEMSESAVISGLGVHSTPNVGQDKIVELSVTDETSVTEDSGAQLTPTSMKCSSKFDNDIMSFLHQQFNLINCRFDVNDNKMDEHNNKFDKINSEFDEQKSDSDVKFNKINSNFNARFDEVNAKMNDQINEIRNEIKLVGTSK